MNSPLDHGRRGGVGFVLLVCIAAVFGPVLFVSAAATLAHEAPAAAAGDAR